ncbi:RluA family pseudouridine synthase [Patescibacteria group bacterium]|nr:RluA family pseudouridine synthase [Patescibacteria group bacterium]MBU1921775.1 RluA family pseudouridine synthase [Patescibacteria group bacterium]
MRWGDKKISVKAEDAGVRLDVFLAAKLGMARARTQKMIKRGDVWVNDKIKTPHYAIKDDDQIRVAKQKSGPEKTVAPKIEIIFSNKDFIVLNKPAGLVTHPPHENYGQTTLTDILCKKFPEIKKVGQASRPGIVHRLDRDVSGLMVIARNRESFDFLKSEFKARRVKKIYTGLVHGKLKEEFGEISFKIAHKTRSGRMAARPENQEGREALTFWRVLKHYKKFTLLQIEIRTGRTHQIRVHLHALGHPLAGDPLYRPKKTGKIVAPRLILHASNLGFYNLNKEWMEFDSPLPLELDNFLKNLN